MTQQELGIFGELKARKYLERLGYTIHTTNYRFVKYEIDIVAEKDNRIVVVEVKTRQTAGIGEPWMAVTRRKQRQIIACADQYMKANDIDRDVRFDIISIVHNGLRSDLEHIVDAFTA